MGKEKTYNPYIKQEKEKIDIQKIYRIINKRHIRIIKRKKIYKMKTRS